MLIFGIAILVIILIGIIWQYLTLRKLPLEVDSQKQEFLKPAFDALQQLHNFRPYVAEIAINKGPFYHPYMCLEYTGDGLIVKSVISNKTKMDKIFQVRKSLEKKLIENKAFTLHTVYRVFLDKNAEPICMIAIIDTDGNHIYKSF